MSKLVGVPFKYCGHYDHISWYTCVLLSLHSLIYIMWCKLWAIIHKNKINLPNMWASDALHNDTCAGTCTIRKDHTGRPGNRKLGHVRLRVKLLFYSPSHLHYVTTSMSMLMCIAPVFIQNCACHMLCHTHRRRTEVQGIWVVMDEKAGFVLDNDLFPMPSLCGKCRMFIRIVLNYAMRHVCGTWTNRMET